MRWCILISNNYEIELYDIINYTISRDDSKLPIKYSFDYIGAVIRNVPVLPYVTESYDIEVTVSNRSDTHEMLELTPLPKKTGK